METEQTEPAGAGKRNFRKALELFLYFFRIGWYTFGGGWSIIAQIERDYCDKKKELKPEELLDLASVGKSLPGVMVGNVTLLFGYHMAGAPGAVLAVAGLTLPPVIILVIITSLYASFRDNVYVAKALTGIRAVVVPIIFASSVKIVPAAFKRWYAWPICAAAALLLIFTGVNALFLVLAAALIGVLLSGKHPRGKEKK